MSIPLKFPGCADNELVSSDSGLGRPLIQAWITDELLDETRRVWSKVYGRIISDEEAIEILTNVKRLAEVLLTINVRLAS